MWKNIIGQDHVIENLKSVFLSGKTGHAYLFEGSGGVGKDAVAIEFAKLLNCLDPVNGNEACDKCDNCRKISAFRSEYFKFICALPASKSDESDSDPVDKLAGSDFDEYMEQISAKSDDPYHRISISGANNIRINSIRDLVSKIYLSAPSGITKVFIVSEADKMKQEASNALLKILEEPPKNSILILTTSKVNSLPQTIIGRCQRVHFEALHEKDIAEKLLTDGGYTEKQVNLAARLCFGSYSRAIDLLHMGIEELRNTALEYLVSLLRNDPASVISICRNISAKNEKKKTRQFLFFLNIWIRDLLRVKAAGEAIPDLLTNYDLAERLGKLNSNFPESDIFNIVLQLEEADKLIGQNIQLTLILVNLSIKLKKYFVKPAV
ncbi:MAG TPA: DNA polymerase III subunit [Ignavibacteria bacterium]|nr:DNA polymerase III subunit [Ignavibacteria bacterium]